VGTWAFPGIQCEECHGKGSLHAQSPDDYEMTVDRSSALCGRCHKRGDPYVIDAKGGFIKHHEQYEELLATKKFIFACVDCHDPHVGLHPNNLERASAIKIDCGTCHYKEAKAFEESDLPHYSDGYDCIDCHMPYAAKSAVAVSTYKADIRSHLFRINADSTAEMFSSDGKSAKGYLTLEYVCLTCHDDPDETKGWAASWAHKVHPHEEEEPKELTAVEVSIPPTLDGSPGDAAWAQASEFTVSLGDGMETFNCGTCHSLNSSVQVKLKAVYTTSKLFILATWPDNTASFTRSGSWSFATGAWTKPNAGQSEDRIAFFFPIGTIGGDDFNTGGCMTKCHTDGSGAYLTTGRGDMWHMKAARSLGVSSASGTGLVIDANTHEVTGGTVTMKGWMDDKYVGAWRDHEDVGRYGDAGSSTYSHNRISDKSRPKYMERNPTDFMDAMILTQSEIDGGEVVGDATNGVSDDSAAVYWPNYAALNAVVPERILDTPTGSRGDLDQAASWNSGTWTAEIARELDTGNDDDVQFTPGNEYIFGIAIMDNGGGEIHKPSGKLTLKLTQSGSAPAWRWWQARR
ncbi:MAG: ethylbenzene dehydrogenase-related protein, partial [Candidatus Zixiibacteriota bacterium]